MAPLKTQAAARSTAARPKVLIVDDEPGLLEMVADTVSSSSLGCKLIPAATIAQARRVIESQRVELLVTDRHLPDGDGLSLLGALHLHNPDAQSIVITGKPTVDCMVEAVREGANDLLPKPFTGIELAQRIKQGLIRATESAKKEKRLNRLRDAVKRLNDARKMVSKKVDLLCNDLISAYGELSKQLDQVRINENFRNVVKNAKDLEQLLCHTMDWMLRQLGYCNIGVWLASENETFQLGAYMKYTIPGEAALTDALRQGLVARAVRDGFYKGSGKELETTLLPQELDFLAGQDVMAINCTYLAESLAVLVLFRDARTPFRDEDAQTLKSIAPLIALSLASAVKEEGAEGSEGAEPWADDPGNMLDDTNADKPPKKKKKDDADWWKRGEEPPF